MSTVELALKCCLWSKRLSQSASGATTLQTGAVG